MTLQLPSTANLTANLSLPSLTLGSLRSGSLRSGSLRSGSLRPGQARLWRWVLLGSLPVATGVLVGMPRLTLEAIATPTSPLTSTHLASTRLAQTPAPDSTPAAPPAPNSTSTPSSTPAPTPRPRPTLRPRPAPTPPGGSTLTKPQPNPAQPSAPLPASPGPSPTPNSPEAQLLNTARQHYSSGKFQDALASLQQLLKAYQQQKKPDLEGETLNLIGLTHDRLKQFDAAAQAYQQALTLYEGISRSGQNALGKTGEARTLNNLGALYAGANKTPEALGFMERALGLFRSIKATENEAITLRNLSGLYLQANRVADAIAALQQSLQLEVQLKRAPQVVELLDRLSSLYVGVGAPGQALIALQEALKIVSQSDDTAAIALLHNRIGQLYESAGNWSKAETAYQQALDLAKKVGDRAAEGTFHLRLAEVAQNSGDGTKALSRYQDALKIATTIQDTGGQLSILTRIGDLQRRLKQVNEARDTYQKALTLLGSDPKQAIARSRLLSSIAVIHRDQGQLKQALDVAQQALKAQQQASSSAKGLPPDEQARLRANEAITLSLLGDIYKGQGQYSPAVSAYQQSLATLPERSNPLLQGTNLTNLGASLLQLNRPKDAIAPLQSALNLWDALGLEALRGSEAGTNQDVVRESYKLLQDAFLAQGQPDQALSVVERERSRLLRAFLDLRRPKDTPPSPPLSLDQIKTAAQAANATVVVYSPLRQTEAKTKQIQEQIRIWTIQPDGKIAQTSVGLTGGSSSSSSSSSSSGNSSPSLDSLVSASRGSSSPQQTASLRTLHQVLIAPIAAQLPKDPQARVILVPPAELLQVPFAALQSAEGKALIDQHTLVIQPGLHALARATTPTPPATPTAKAKPGSTPVVVGNPSLPGFKDNPQAASLAQAIAKTLDTQALVGKQATRTTVTQALPSASLIHLSVPYLDVQVIGEALGLASDKDIEALSPADVLTLQLAAKLVVLHGLEGNLDQAPRRDLSLAQAFLATGVPLVITSIGKPSDAAARDLLTAFYDQLKAGQLKGSSPDPIQALRQAMLKTKVTHPDPKDWASFAIMGTP